MRMRRIDQEVGLDGDAIAQLLDEFVVQQHLAFRLQQDARCDECRRHRDLLHTFGPFFFSSGAAPAARMWMKRFSTSNQKADPSEMATAVSSHPSKWLPATGTSALL